MSNISLLQIIPQKKLIKIIYRLYLFVVPKFTNSLITRYRTRTDNPFETNFEFAVSTIFTKRAIDCTFTENLLIYSKAKRD